MPKTNRTAAPKMTVRMRRALCAHAAVIELTDRKVCIHCEAVLAL